MHDEWLSHIMYDTVRPGGVAASGRAAYQHVLILIHVERVMLARGVGVRVYKSGPNGDVG